ncbi:hypothetical protein LzC2_26560 [Planctomycetes bacterium LzC2]|uniref:Uncharacterized protein n=1 Tax=Alienimonas chondri TaxID=2681879 RepID=A0ABX1VH42_9PLAN|nr:hypothetical protein [Alienimonas chondri]
MCDVSLPTSAPVPSRLIAPVPSVRITAPSAAMPMKSPTVGIACRLALRATPPSTVVRLEPSARVMLRAAVSVIVPAPLVASSAPAPTAIVSAVTSRLSSAANVTSAFRFTVSNPPAPLILRAAAKDGSRGATVIVSASVPPKISRLPVGTVKTVFSNVLPVSCISPGFGPAARVASALTTFGRMNRTFAAVPVFTSGSSPAKTITEPSRSMIPSNPSASEVVKV